jgi:outer membrane immunogenic protein
MNMRKFVAGACAIASLPAVAATAAAADLRAAPPYRAAVPAESPTYSWTGLYAGFNLGYGRVETNGGFRDGAAASASRSGGVIGGGQFGYNWQTGYALLGLEADLQASGQRVQTTFATPGLVIREKDEIPWFGTVRGRLGITPTDGLLLYASGGLAYGRAKASGTVTVPASGAAGFEASEVKFGWTAGGGIEAAVLGHWTMKLEYLHIDLGDLALNTTVRGAPLISNAHIKDDIVRVGLNYRF